MDSKSTKQEKKKLALLSLFSIIGIVLCGLSHYYKPLLVIGIPLCLIGGICLGKLISLIRSTNY